MASPKVKSPPTTQYKKLENPHLPKNDDRFYGLINTGNTCYSNSVVQLLYFCKPFRDCVNNFPKKRLLPIETQKVLRNFDPASLEKQISALSTTDLTGLELIDNEIVPEAYGTEVNSSQKYNIPQNMFTALKDLFWHITTRVSRVGTYNPSRFISCLKQNNILFSNNHHQDAHEMFNYLINEIAENVANIYLTKDLQFGSGRPWDPKDPHVYPTWVHTLFQGEITNETTCLTCENVTNRDESFMDLSVDIENNTSVTNCLRQFASGEILSRENKFYCEKCGALQEAERRTRLKRLPNILALHLKRFKYSESIGNYTKLNYRVNYPLNLRVPGITSDAEDIEYSLVGAVVHLGSGLFQGHYIAITRSANKWIIFDDDYVDIIHESDLDLYFGDSLTYGGIYVLLYERTDFNLSEFDLPGQNPPKDKQNSSSETSSSTSDLAGFNSNQPVSDNLNATPATSGSVPQSENSYSESKTFTNGSGINDSATKSSMPFSQNFEPNSSEPIPINPKNQKPNATEYLSHSYQSEENLSSSVLSNIINYHSSSDSRKPISRTTSVPIGSEISPRLPPESDSTTLATQPLAQSNSNSTKNSIQKSSFIKPKSWKLFGKK
ncbi:hypothetical protein BB560_001852 [Smittium megazygosporum]|uniref:ubiquitinyl hydrolase 1 n=1 Tax=Smittium megazygosporum TaxID=133381 RepID=A0A2T9ZGG4_9FUNG|nr:hypothetical protein BB560_001852 [Smittium megazygosporum]